MTFDLPTTKAEMYASLHFIYHSYRVLKNGYTAISRQPLTLPRLTYVPKTDNELSAEAQVMLREKQQREIDERKEKLSTTLAEKQALYNGLASEKALAIQVINDKYDVMISTVKRSAQERGVSDSYTVKKIYEAEKARAQELSATEINYATKANALNAEITVLTQQIAGADTFFSTVHGYQLIAKTQELKNAQDQTVMEVTKYNNYQFEKEGKYSNFILSSDANIEIDYMKVKAESLTPELLEELGYYDDVLLCVNTYYMSLAPDAAYRDIVNESKLMVYLDNYYQNWVYLYKQRAVDYMDTL